MTETTYARAIMRSVRNRDDSALLDQAMDLGTDIGLSRVEVYTDIAAEEVAVADDEHERFAGLVKMINDQYRWAIRRHERPAGHLAEFLFYAKYGFQRFDTDDHELYEQFVEQLRESVEEQIQQEHELNLRYMYTGDC